MTPFLTNSGPLVFISCKIALRAPRSLKDPVNCRNSVLRNTFAPTSSDKKYDFSQVVRTTPLRMACRNKSEKANDSK